MLVHKKKTDFPVWGDVFGNFFSNDWLNFPQNTKGMLSTFPAVNVKENESEYLVEMAVPGKSKEDFQLDVNDKVLTISSEERKSSEEKDDNYTRKEFSYASFRRSFRLPELADEDKCTANYTDGILKVTIPKKEIKKPGVKSISIS